MKTRFLISTAVGLLFATAAYAQSPNATGTSSANQQTQTPNTSSTATQKSNATTGQTPSTSTSSGTSTGSSQAQTTAPASSGGSSASTPAQAQTNNPPANSQAQAPAGGSPNTTAPANNAAQTPSSNNTAQNPSSNNTAQTPSTSNTAQTPSNNSTAQTPSTNNNSAQNSSTSNTAQSSSSNVNASVNINDQQRTRVTESISRLNVQPLNNVNFSLNVGTAVPRDIRVQTLPPEVAEVVPQYRGYSFFVVRDEIVIVEPSSYQIVTVLPRSGGSTAAAPAPTRSREAFTDKDRDAVRKHVKTRTTERQTTGSSARTVIRRGERLPESVEVEEFPETVYREAPSLRDYRYIHRENRTYLVEPHERTVIEEID